MLRNGLLFFTITQKKPESWAFWTKKKNGTFYQNYRSFVAKNANFDRNAPPWVLGVQIALGGASSMGVRKLKQKSYDTVFEALMLTKRRR